MEPNLEERFMTASEKRRITRNEILVKRWKQYFENREVGSNRYLNSLSEEFGMHPLTIRKILVQAGVYCTWKV